MLQSTVLEITCESCDGDFLVYEDYLEEDQEEVTCPYCGQQASLLEENDEEDPQE